MRLSILTLLGLVAVAAIGTAALLNANAVWGMLVYTGAVLILLVSIIASVYSRAVNRAFWVGFAVFGWGYFLLYQGVLIEWPQELATTIPLKFFAAKQAAFVVSVDYFGTNNITGIDDRYLMQVGHSLWVLVFGVIGGLTACYFYWLGQKQEADIAPQSR